MYTEADVVNGSAQAGMKTADTDGYNAGKDLYTLYMMIQELVPFIYQDNVFGRSAGSLYQLTLGGVLLRLKRMNALRDLLNPLRQGHLDALEAEFIKTRETWKAHYRRKVERELSVRMEMIRIHLADYKESSNAEDYRLAAQQRTMVYHLQHEADALGMWDAESEAALADIDKKLRAIKDDGATGFILPEPLQEAYPQDIFWWLYRSPVETPTSTYQHY